MYSLSPNKIPWIQPKSSYSVVLSPSREGFVARHSAASMYDCCSARVALLHSLRSLGEVHCWRAFISLELGFGFGFGFEVGAAKAACKDDEAVRKVMVLRRRDFILETGNQ